MDWLTVTQAASATAAWLRELWPWLLIPAIPAAFYGFRSPVFAERVPDNQEVDCNIVRCEDVADITQELDALAQR